MNPVQYNKILKGIVLTTKQLSPDNVSKSTTATVQITHRMEHRHI